MTKAENYQLLINPSEIRNVTKKEDNVIVFPHWTNLGLMGKIFAQMIFTKENTDGQHYDEYKYRAVFRVLGGKVLINGLPDAYTWTTEKYCKEQAKGHISPIGVNTSEGIINLTEVLSSVKDKEEKCLLASLFIGLNNDLELVRTMAEHRRAVCVTQEMLTRCAYCINEWTDNDIHCMLHLGDWLIVNEEKESLYRVGQEEFELTYDLDE